MDLADLARLWANRRASHAPSDPALQPSPDENHVQTECIALQPSPSIKLPAALVSIHHGAPDSYSACKRAWISEFGSNGTLDAAAVTCPGCRRKLPTSPAAPPPVVTPPAELEQAAPVPVVAREAPPIAAAGVEAEPVRTTPRRLPVMKRTQASAFVVYRGPSAFGGAPILAIVTGATGATGSIVKGSKNEKTGPMAQLWILAADEAPHMAQKSGADAAACGDCRLRHATAKGLLCYVETRKGPRSTWEANADAPVRLEACVETLRRAKADLRLGAYGDPAALPPEVVETLARAAAMSTGYTHAWRRASAGWLRPYAMASCETEADVAAAASAGWRTFRIVEGDASAILEQEVLCPAATHGTRCIDCGLCDGARTADARKSVAIPVHGRQKRPADGRLFPEDEAPAPAPCPTAPPATGQDREAPQADAPSPPERDDLGEDDGSERYRVLSAFREEPNVSAGARRAGIPRHTFRRRVAWYQAGNLEPPAQGRPREERPSTRVRALRTAGAGADPRGRRVAHSALDQGPVGGDAIPTIPTEAELEALALETPEAEVSPWDPEAGTSPSPPADDEEAEEEEEDPPEPPEPVEPVDVEEPAKLPDDLPVNLSAELRRVVAARALDAREKARMSGGFYLETAAEPEPTEEPEDEGYGEEEPEEVPAPTEEEEGDAGGEGGEDPSVTLGLDEMRAMNRTDAFLEEAGTIASYERPMTRGDCMDGERPCPWVGCRWNLYLDVLPEGRLKINFPRTPVEEMEASCVLDIADRGERTLDGVGRALNITRERVRQIERKATKRIKEFRGGVLRQFTEDAPIVVQKAPPHRPPLPPIRPVVRLPVLPRRPPPARPSPAAVVLLPEVILPRPVVRAKAAPPPAPHPPPLELPARPVADALPAPMVPLSQQPTVILDVPTVQANILRHYPDVLGLGRLDEGTIGALNPYLRTVIWYLYHAGMPAQDVANRLNVSLSFLLKLELRAFVHLGIWLPKSK